MNGNWAFAITKSHSKPAVYGEKIQVPFAPETPLSGIFRMVDKDDFLHYKKELILPEDFYSSCLVLHFEAIDQVADVYLNGKPIAHHEGGYWPFSVYLDHISKGDYLEVTANDDTDSIVFPVGKQSSHPTGIWYRPTSGIWGDVWIEKVPTRARFTFLKISPDYDTKKVNFTVGSSSYLPSIVKVYHSGKLVGETNVLNDGQGTIDLSNAFHAWSPSKAALYEVKIENKEDKVRSYFGFRKVSILDKDDMKFVALNDEPIFLHALLDQGYYSQSSGLTPRSEEDTVNDLTFVKEAGFNTLRKHIKIESRHWYYLCDKMGIIVIQDIVSGGDHYEFMKQGALPTIGVNLASGKTNENIARSNPLSKAMFEKDLLDTLDLLSTVTSIVAYTLFNEGWGQFDSIRLTQLLRDNDGGHHLIDSDSGWFDVGTGDFSSKHIYFRRPRIHNDHKRILSLSEFGGYSLPIPNHIYATKSFGYRKIKSRRKLFEALQKTYIKWLIPLIRNRGLGVSVYTQLSDVEGETNGLLTYDRLIIKVPVQYLLPISKAIYEAFEERFKTK